MKYYITGINGFIGFTLAKKLSELGHEVTGIDYMNHYYDVSLKIARNRILVKEHGIKSRKHILTHYRWETLVEYFYKKILLHI